MSCLTGNGTEEKNRLKNMITGLSVEDRTYVLQFVETELIFNELGHRLQCALQLKDDMKELVSRSFIKE